MASSQIILFKNDLLSCVERKWNMGTTRNAPVSQNDTDLVMKVISDRIAKEYEKLKPLTPHTLRHTFATRCIERGMNPKTVQVILGHSSVNITMNLYCYVTEDTLISEMSKFEAEGPKKGVNRRIDSQQGKFSTINI